MKKIINSIIDNKIIQAIVIIIAIAGASVWICNIIYSNKIDLIESYYEAKLIKCNDGFASIQRSMIDGKADYFDLNSILVESDENIDNRNEKRYFETDEFYALEDSSYWQFNLGDEFEQMIARSSTTGEIALRKLQAANDIPQTIYQWKGKDVYEISDFLLAGRKIETYFNDRIMFQRMNIDSLFLFGVALGDLEENLTERAEFEEDMKRSFISSAIFDMIYMANYLSDNAQSENKRLSYEIQNIQKQNNSLYVRIQITFYDLTVKGKLRSKFYYVNEMISWIDTNSIYVLNISSPSFEKLNINPEVSRWLNNFKIIRD
jgi:hypothetical protein